MHNNIEQAVLDVVSAQQKVVLPNVISAYVRVAGFPEWCHDALVAFERALDKQPDSADKADCISAKLISDIRQSYWYNMLGVGGVEGGQCGATMLVKPLTPEAVRSMCCHGASVLPKRGMSPSRLFIACSRDSSQIKEAHGQEQATQGKGYRF